MQTRIKCMECGKDGCLSNFTVWLCQACRIKQNFGMPHIKQFSVGDISGRDMIARAQEGKKNYNEKRDALKAKHKKQTRELITSIIKE